MQKAFVVWLALVVGLYVLAQASLDRPDEAGVVRMSWATDPNPARTVQAGLFGEMYPGLEVFVDPGLGGDQTKLIVQCATGVGPDIVDVYNQQQLWNLVQSGILLDITSHAERMGFAPRHTYPSVEDALKVEGRQYCFPANVWANCVIYNRAIFDDHGVPYPEAGWTYEQFVDTARRIRDTPSRSGDTHLAVAHWSPVWFVQDTLMGAGGRMFSEDGLRSALDEPAALATMLPPPDARRPRATHPSGGGVPVLARRMGQWRDQLVLHREGSDDLHREVVYRAGEELPRPRGRPGSRPSTSGW